MFWNSKPSLKRASENDRFGRFHRKLNGTLMMFYAPILATFYSLLEL